MLYGKSAIGLARDLGLFANTEELIEGNLLAVEEFILNNLEDFKTHCLEQHNGKETKLSRKTFIKIMRNKGLFLPDIITGDDLIQRFKNAFPLLNAYLADGAESAVNRQYIRTADIFGRIRFFERPANIKEEKAIFREAMNFPIQGSSAGMTKYACVLIKKKIEAENWQDKVQFVLSIHDEIITFVREDFAEEWLKIMMELMEQAGEFILENKLQKAEGGLSDVWQK